MKRILKISTNELSSCSCNFFISRAPCKMGYQGKVGIILNPSPSYPKSMNNPKDIEAAKICDMFNYKQYTDPLINGKFDEAYFELLKNMSVCLNMLKVILKRLMIIK